ncbi:MAG: restriction endonuclease subunit S [Verrucomicrobiota bacterium]
MGSEWSYSTIADCASEEPFSTQIGPFGNKIKAEIYTPKGAPVLRGTNVNTNSRFNDADFVFIDQDYADSEFEKFTCKAGDVVLCHKGTLGKIGIIPKNSRFETYIMGNSMMKVRTDEKKLNSSFLYYWLCSFEGQDYLFSRVSQVGVPQIQRPLSTLREAEIPLPPLPEQKAIAHILGTLDDKIELNRRMNATLEGMAQALFKSWFVDFDPVIDNALATGNAIPDELAPRAEARKKALASDTTQQGSVDHPTLSDPKSLFPAAFEFTEELGWMPKGWELSTIGDECETVGGGTPSTKNPDFWDGGEYPWVTPKDFSSLQDKVLLSSSRFLTKEGLNKVSSGLLPIGTVLMSSRAPVGYLAITQIETAINQGFIAMICNGRLSPEYILQWANSRMDDIKQTSSGSTFAEISKKAFRPFRVIVPTDNALESYTNLVGSIYHRIASNLAESATLTSSRDALLPQLISGELRVDA